MNRAAISLAGWLGDYYLLATLLLLAALVAWRCVRQPVHRMLIAWTVMLEMFALAVVCALPFWPRISLRAARAPAAEPAAEAWAAGGGDLAAGPRLPVVRPGTWHPALLAPREPESPPPAAAEPATAMPPWSWVELVAGGYCAGVLLAGSWLGWGAVAAVRLCRRSRPATEALRAELTRIARGHNPLPRLLLSDRVRSAVALGVVRPAIVLPAAWLESTPPHALRAVLAHEWAHVRNRDLWLLALGRWLLAVLFAHPLFWWLRRAIRGDQELLADAIAAGENRQGYAEQLVQLARKPPLRLGPRGLVSPAVGIDEGPSQLSRRIAVLLDESFHVDLGGSRGWKRPSLGLMVLLGVACSLVTLRPAPSAGQPAADTTPAAAKPAAEAAPAAPNRAETPEGPGTYNTGTLTITSTRVYIANGPSDGDEGIVLPLCSQELQLLMEPPVLKDLKLTTEQTQKLRAIAKKHIDDLKKRPAEKGPAPSAQWYRQERKQIQAEAERILTPEQVKLLKDLSIRNLAWMRIPDSQGWARLGLTEEQQKAMRSLGQEMQSWTEKTTREMNERALGSLTAQQRLRLREEALGPLGPQDGLQMVPIRVAGGADLLLYYLWPYPDFAGPPLREQLGLSPAQQQQVRDILGGSTTLAEALAREVGKLPPEERKKLPPGSQSSVFNCACSSGFCGESPEQVAKFWDDLVKARRNERAGFAEQPVMKPAVRLRKRFEALLTPKQLELYRDQAAANFATNVTSDQVLLRMIGASEKQAADIERLLTDHGRRLRQFRREMAGKLFGLLTPAQQASLRADVEAQMRQFDPFAESAGGAAATPVGVGSTTLTFTGSPRGEAAKPGAGTPAAGAGNSYSDGAIIMGGTLLVRGANSAAGPVGEVVLENTAGTTADEVGSLPAYGLLADATVRKPLSLSGEQENKLREISAEYVKEAATRAKPPEGVPADKQPAKAAELRRSFEQWMKQWREKTEAVLTPQQRDAYKTLVFPRLALDLLAFPEIRKAVGVTAEQEKERAARQQAWERQGEDLWRKQTGRALALLRAEQREQLRKEVERDPAIPGASRVYAGMLTLAADNAADRTLYGVDYTDALLVQAAVGEQLGLSPAQRKRLDEIVSNYQAEQGKLLSRYQQLAPEERKRRQAEFAREAAQSQKAASDAMESLLTSQQLTALKDVVFQNLALGPLLDPRNREKFGLSKGQTAALGQIMREGAEEQVQTQKRFADESVGVLTAEQRKKLRSEINRRGSW
jgi:Zn-dependent protease with chaperone function